MSSFVIKVIACIFMFCDHIKYASPELVNFVTVYLGRIAFPLFAFLITEGYAHTKDVYKYRKRLFVTAIISQVPFILFRTLVGEWNCLNIIFTFVISINAMMIYDKLNNKFLAVLADLFLIILAEFLHIEYGWYAMVVVLIFHIFKNKKVWMSILYILTVIVYYLVNELNIFVNVNAMIYAICTILPLIFILMYNGKKGRDDKRLFYYFYPVHLIVIYIFSFM